MKMATRLAGTAALALTLGLLAVPSAQASSTVTVTVHAADAPPPGTSVMPVTEGDSLTVTATGLAQYGYQGAGLCTGYPETDPDGNEYINGVFCGVIESTNATLPKAPIGALIGRISGGGGWFLVGSSRTWSAGRTGTLYLAYNDSVYSDNSGSYSATVTDNG